MRNAGHGITSIIVRLAAGSGLLVAGVSGIVTGLNDLAGQQVRTYLEGGGGHATAQLVLFPMLLGLDTLAGLLLAWAGVHGVCALPGNEGWRRCRKGVALGASLKVAALVVGLLALTGRWRGLYLDPGWPATDRAVLAGVAVLLAVGVIGVPRPWPGTDERPAARRATAARAETEPPPAPAGPLAVQDLPIPDVLDAAGVPAAPDVPDVPDVPDRAEAAVSGRSRRS